MATQTFQFEGYSLDTFIQAWSESLGQRIETVPVPRREGVLQSDGLPEYKRISLRGVLVANTATCLRTIEDTVVSRLRNTTGDSPVGKLRVWDDRYIDAQLDNYHREYVLGHNLKAARFQAAFVAATPFWLADTCTTDTRATSSTSLTYALTGGGTAKAPVRITLTAGENGIGAGLRFVNQAENLYIQFSSCMSSGDVLVLDSENLTAEKNGSNVLANITGDFLSLIPGSNSIQYLGTTSSSGTISVEWRDRWA